MMQTPKIKIDGKEYKAQKKMKLFRNFVRISNSQSDMETEEGIDELITFIASCFPKEVTPEKVEEEMDFDEFFALFGQIGRWIRATVDKKLIEVPKETAGES